MTTKDSMMTCAAPDSELLRPKVVTPDMLEDMHAWSQRLLVALARGRPIGRDPAYSEVRDFWSDYATTFHRNIFPDFYSFCPVAEGQGYVERFCILGSSEIIFHKLQVRRNALSAHDVVTLRETWGNHELRHIPPPGLRQIHFSPFFTQLPPTTVHQSSDNSRLYHSVNLGVQWRM